MTIAIRRPIIGAAVDCMGRAGGWKPALLVAMWVHQGEKEGRVIVGIVATLHKRLAAEGAKYAVVVGLDQHQQSADAIALPVEVLGTETVAGGLVLKHPSLAVGWLHGGAVNGWTGWQPASEGVQMVALDAELRKVNADTRVEPHAQPHSHCQQAVGLVKQGADFLGAAGAVAAQLLDLRQSGLDGRQIGDELAQLCSKKKIITV